jgi:hypothetical protein
MLEGNGEDRAIAERGSAGRKETMNAIWSASPRYRPEWLTTAGLGALLLVGAAGCGRSSDSDPLPTPQSARQHASMTPSLAAAERATTGEVTPDASNPDTGASPERASVDLDDALVAKAREEGAVLVIATLAISYRPEAELTQAEVTTQRAAIASAQDALIASIDDGNLTVMTRMTLFPQIVLLVDEVALQRLASSPLVSAIQENAPEAPTT